MSTITTSTVLGRQPSFEALCAGDETGYTVCLANTNDNVRTDYRAMHDKDSRQAAVTRLANHVRVLIESMNTENLEGEVVSEITIGKSHIGKKGRNAVRATDPSTWTVAGVPSRWTHYKEIEYSCLVVFECFCRSDVPPLLKDLGFDQQDLGLKFEDLVIKELKRMQNDLDEENEDLSDEDAAEQTFKNVKICNKDDGGGGKRSTTYAGFVLYVAMKLVPGGSSDEESESN